jgi:hypothetical protein
VASHFKIVLKMVLKLDVYVASVLAIRVSRNRLFKIGMLLTYDSTYVFASHNFNLLSLYRLILRMGC